MMKVWLVFIKIFLDLGDWIGRRCFYRRHSPNLEPVRVDVSYGPHRLQRLDAYRPSGGERLPVLVYVHGGGWISGDKATYTRLCQEIAGQGFLVFNANYRLAPAQSFPVPFQDIARAIAWAQAHAEEYGGDPQRIFLAGESAGAQMILWYATLLHSAELADTFGITRTISPSALQGLVLFFGLYDLVNAGSWPAQLFVNGFLGNGDGRGERARLASPIYQLSPDLPACLVICGERDILYPHSLGLVERMNECQVRYQTLFFPSREYPNAGHAFSKWPNRRCTQEALQAMVKFMKEIGEK